jgi:glycosyltransferase involved in cell wall biosynthesis
MTEEFGIHVCVTKKDSFLCANWDTLFADKFNDLLKLWKLPASKQYSFLLEYLERHEIKIIYVTHSLWLYQHVAQLRRDIPFIRIVDSLHVLEPYCFRGGYPDISANRYVHPYIDISILISSNLLKYITRHYRVETNKIVVIRNGIDDEKFKFDPTIKGKFKVELGIPLQSYLVGFIGRLTEQKRPLHFIETAYDLAAENPELYFYMVGSGKLQEKVNKSIARLGLKDRIFLFQKRDDVNYLLNSTDILMVPSSYEGAPLTILESLSVGVPVVASDVGAISEYVNNRCILIPRSNKSDEKKQYAKAVLKSIHDSRVFMPLDAQFQLKNVILSYRDVFERLLE